MRAQYPATFPNSWMAALCFHLSADQTSVTHSDDHKHCWSLTNSAAQTSPHPAGVPPPWEIRENPHKVVLSVLSTATVPPHEGMAPDWVEHLDEGEGPHCDLTGALHLEARLLVKGNQEIFTHKHSTANIGQAAEVLQVAPHQDGAFALLAEGTVDSQDMDVDSGAMRLMEGQGILKRGQTNTLITKPVGLI